MDSFPWVPKHDKPAVEKPPVPKEVVPDSGDQIPAEPEEAPKVVESVEPPAAKKPAAKRSHSKKKGSK